MQQGLDVSRRCVYRHQGVALLLGLLSGVVFASWALWGPSPAWSQSLPDKKDAREGVRAVISPADSLRVYRYPQEFVVTATRFPASIEKLPYQVDVLTQRSIDDAARGTVPDLVAGAPGVMLQKTTAGGGSVYLSGLLGNYCLLLVDGIRLNNSTLRSGPNQYLNTIGPGEVERIEIVQGAGSVLYGSDAVGGVVNVITRSPRWESSRAPAVILTGQTGGSDSRRLGSLELSQKLGPFAAQVNLSGARYGNLRGGDSTGVQRPTGYAARGAMFKLAAAVGRSGLLTGTYQMYEQMDVPRYDSFLSSAYPSSKYLEYTYDPQKRSLASLRSRQSLPFLGRPTMEATVSYHHQDEGRRYISVPKPGKPEIVVRERDRVNTLGLQFQGQWGPETGQTLVVGTETYQDQITSARQDTDKPTGRVTKKQGSFPGGTRYVTSALYSRWSRPVARGATLHLGGAVQCVRHPIGSDGVACRFREAGGNLRRAHRRGSADAATPGLVGSIVRVVPIPDSRLLPGRGASLPCPERL
jgi:outer membrane receptor protein involved in Fe transport